MATTKPKKTASKAKSSTKAKTAAKSTKSVKTEKTVKPAVVAKKEVEQKVETKPTNTNVVKDFFAKKCDNKENILTIFKDKAIYGALIGEIFGTMFMTMVLLTLGVYQPLYLLFAIILVTVAVYSLSGAHLNPIVTAGMMASRRVSAIRGTLYIIAQILGAWLGLVIINAFRIAGGEIADLPVMADVADGTFWMVSMIEFMGATIIGFFFARALQYKRSALTFAAEVGGGVMVAFVAAIIVSSTYCSLSDNFILNPAVALMYQILPTSGETAGELLGGIGMALLTYAVFPVVGGIIGFYISDIASKLKGESVQQ